LVELAAPAARFAAKCSTFDLFVNQIVDSINDLGHYMSMPSSSCPTLEQLNHRGTEPHLLREIIRTHQVLMTGFSRGVGVPASRFTLMRLVALAENDIGIMDLARQLGVNPAAVTRQVKEMDMEGLIRRRSDPKDARRSYVSLSPKGLKLFKQIHARSHDLESRLSSLISNEEMRVAVDVLSKLRVFLEEQT